MPPRRVIFNRMPVTKNRIVKNLQRIRGNIAAACGRVGRTEQEVSMVAVTKAVDMETIKNAIDAGLRDLGESRVQALIERAADLTACLRRRANSLPGRVRWHMIGHLQRNKVKAVLEASDIIHSVDSLRLVEELNRQAERADRSVDIFLQVNCSREPQKFGAAVGAASHLAEIICTLKNLRLIGLMTMAPFVDDPEQARPTFVRLRELFEEMRVEKIGGDDFKHLSMGMSQDYAVAVEEGATVLRIGTALFE